MPPSRAPKEISPREGCLPTLSPRNLGLPANRGALPQQWQSQRDDECYLRHGREIHRPPPPLHSPACGPKGTPTVRVTR